MPNRAATPSTDGTPSTISSDIDCDGHLTVLILTVFIHLLIYY